MKYDDTLEFDEMNRNKEHTQRKEKRINMV